MDFIDSQSATKLREIIDALERLEAQKAVLQEEMRDILKDASNDGFDPKIIKQVMKIKKTKEEDREKQEELLTVYMHAIGLPA